MKSILKWERTFSGSSYIAFAPFLDGTDKEMYGDGYVSICMKDGRGRSLGGFRVEIDVDDHKCDRPDPPSEIYSTLSEAKKAVSNWIKRWCPRAAAGLVVRPLRHGAIFVSTEWDPQQGQRLTRKEAAQISRWFIRSVRR